MVTELVIEVETNSFLDKWFPILLNGGTHKMNHEEFAYSVIFRSVFRLLHVLLIHFLSLHACISVAIFLKHIMNYCIT